MTRKYHTANCIWLYFALTSLYVYIKLSSDANQILLNNIILLIISITNWNKKWMTKSSYKYNFLLVIFDDFSNVRSICRPNITALLLYLLSYFVVIFMFFISETREKVHTSTSRVKILVTWTWNVMFFVTQVTWS